MSASGFTWCYLLVVGLVGSVLPMSLIESAKEGAPPVEGMIFDPATLQAFFDLGYVVIIFPILGSGLAITVQAWRSLARRRMEKTAGVMDYVVVGWDTFAQVHNTISAMRALPGTFDRLGGFFGSGSKSSGDSKDKGVLLVVVAVALAALGGILTTYSILQARRRAVVIEDYNRTQSRDAA